MVSFMRLESLPQPTSYDPADDPPGSVDPLGTVPGAEQLADLLFPGMTARMWRARHLTFVSLAALVAERVAQTMPNGESSQLEARLAFERLFVAAIAKQERRDDDWHAAARRLPGIGLARRAIDVGNQPLGRRNFLKGQAINGPFGVAARLARNLTLLADEEQLSRNGELLLMDWAKDQELSGLLDENGSGSVGARWLRDVIRKVGDVVENESQWPANSWQGWEELAQRLRPDQIGSHERTNLRELLRLGLRQKMLDLLSRRDVVSAYRSATGDRGFVERHILVDHLLPMVTNTDNEVDRAIALTIRLFDAYEQTSGYLEVGIRGLLWRLTHRAGRATRDELLADPRLAKRFTTASKQLARQSERLRTELALIAEVPQVLDALNRERLDQLLLDGAAGAIGPESLVTSVLDRHERIQKQKKKGVWIEDDGRYLTLLPGFGDSSEEPPTFDGSFLHPFRVLNAYSFLRDLGQVRFQEASDAEET